MNGALILHHYELSPYAEKIRLMFGLTDSHWQSLLSPAMPPRPNLDPLTGGYRRIPVAQLGADIFCDTAIIAREVAELTSCSALNVDSLNAEARALAKQAETEVFFAAVAAVPKLRALGSMLRLFGPIGTVKFVKDRASMMDGAKVTRPSAGSPEATLKNFLETLESTLANGKWLGGDNASVADLAAYHPLWLHTAVNRRAIDGGPHFKRWYQNVSAIGHGRREEIDQATAFSVAKDSEPRPLPESAFDGDIANGKQVSVCPADYGMVAVEGTLAAVAEDRIVVARETPQFGLLHVHFPREGYSLTAL